MAITSFSKDLLASYEEENKKIMRFCMEQQYGNFGNNMMKLVLFLISQHQGEMTTLNLGERMSHNIKMQQALETVLKGHEAALSLESLSPTKNDAKVEELESTIAGAKRQCTDNSQALEQLKHQCASLKTKYDSLYTQMCKDIFSKQHEIDQGLEPPSEVLTVWDNYWQKFL